MTFHFHRDDVPLFHGQHLKKHPIRRLKIKLLVKNPVYSGKKQGTFFHRDDVPLHRDDVPFLRVKKWRPTIGMTFHFHRDDVPFYRDDVPFYRDDVPPPPLEAATIAEYRGMFGLNLF